MFGNPGTPIRTWQDKQEILISTRPDGTLLFEAVNGKHALRFDSRRAPDTTRLIDASTATLWKFEKTRDTSIGAYPPVPGPVWQQRLSLDRSTGQFHFSTEISFPVSPLENNNRSEGFCEKIDTTKLKF